MKLRHEKIVSLENENNIDYCGDIRIFTRAVECLDALNVVSSETKLFIVSVVERTHYGARYAGVSQAQRVTNLVRCHL